MIKTVPNPRATLHSDVERLLAQHGVRRILTALLASALVRRQARRARPPDAGHLDAHLRRDVGLHVEPRSHATHYIDFALKSSR